MSSRILEAVSEAKSVHLVRLSGRLKYCFDRGRVAIGWCSVPGMERLVKHGDVKRALSSRFSPDEGRALGSAVGNVVRFNRISDGDIILVPVPGGFHVARVRSSTNADSCQEAVQADCCYYKDVDWLTKRGRAIPRSYASTDLQRWMKGRQTVLEGDNRLLAALKDAVSRTSPQDFVESVRDDAIKAVSDALRNVINDSDLENLVVKLCKASGADARVQPKQQDLPGDVDVIAVWNLGFTEFRAFFQIKHHEGRSGREAFRQLASRREAINAKRDLEEDYDAPRIDRWCVVTTADEVIDGQDPDIDVITLEQLSEWILKAGLSALSS